MPTKRTQFWTRRYWTWCPPLRKPILSSSFCLRMPSPSAPVPLPKCLALVSCAMMVSSPSAAGNNHLFSSESCPRNTANVKVRRMLRTIYGPREIRNPTRCLHRAYIVHDFDRAFYLSSTPRPFPPFLSPRRHLSQTRRMTLSSKDERQHRLFVFLTNTPHSPPPRI